ncbi:hypothetical protein MFRU_013g02350 [Monilinia fructicola]|uniref:BTB domain-containing protein n=1 Tax=Monilinia fructicola TaxID=38448 RepID=A0A5M9J5P1_MONFR|nr:hypothetical protein EYC84_011618 [Monilinia fructicola]KAG4030217.1 hypothetical protein MFRU_013g02350 [Monilinia fructicola]
MSFERPEITGDLPFPKIPIMFKNPGHVADVRITVFGQEYHVHSVILRLYSNYFRRFLDAPNRKAPAIYAPFAYEYAAIMDDDGEWGLEPVSAEAQDTPPDDAQFEKWDSLLTNNRCIYTEAAAFHNVLKAMYHRPITIDSFFQFADTVRLADFYCALPIVSASTDLILRNLIPSPSFLCNPQDITRSRKKMLGDWFCTHPLDMCILSYKLHHKELFHDALIFVVGKWPRMLSEYERTKSARWNWRAKLEPHPKVIETIEYSLAHLIELQSAVATNLRRDAATCPLVSYMVNDIEKQIQRRDPEYSRRTPLETARFYMTLMNGLRKAIQGGRVGDEWKIFLGELKILLNFGPVLVDELPVDVVRDQFWCARVEEGVFPWEAEDVDW